MSASESNRMPLPSTAKLVAFLLKLQPAFQEGRLDDETTLMMAAAQYVVAVRERPDLAAMYTAAGKPLP